MLNDNLRTVSLTFFLSLAFMLMILSLFGKASAKTVRFPSFTVSPVDVDRSNYITLPDDFPLFTTTQKEGEDIDGYIFTTASRYRGTGENRGRNYLLMFDNDGEPVYWYQRLPEPGSNEPFHGVFDFKPHFVGDEPVLSYLERPMVNVRDEPRSGAGYLWNNSYQEIESFQSISYPDFFDIHDFQILPNGNRIISAYPETRRMDLTEYGGLDNVSIVDFAFEEIDPDGNVVFHWNSAEHYDIALTDTRMYTFTDEVRLDYVHGNSVEKDTDGNYLVSLRGMSEIAKISFDTGEVLWHMGGGPYNEFTFVNDQVEWHTNPNSPENFRGQHDVRRLENGNLLMFDNRVSLNGTQEHSYSRAVEYEVDEVNKIATKVWEYIHPSGIYAGATGSVQRLNNGNTLIEWGTAVFTGSSDVAITEVNEQDEIVFEVEFQSKEVIYRAYRFPWEGHPVDTPVLTGTTQADSVILNYSWNGATEVVSYNIYANDMLISDQTKTQFEEATQISVTQSGVYTFHVVPVDESGIEMAVSNIVVLDIPQATPTVVTQSNDIFVIERSWTVAMLLSVTLLVIISTVVCRRKPSIDSDYT